MFYILLRKRAFHIRLGPFFYRKIRFWKETFPFLQNTPVEFFGVPLDDEILLQAPTEFVLAVCQGAVTEETYDEHLSQLLSGSKGKSQVLKSFFKVLAGLEMEDQEECFEAIVETLTQLDGTTDKLAHVIKRLETGKLRRLGGMVVLLCYRVWGEMSSL